jgi:hypothetical protein
MNPNQTVSRSHRLAEASYTEALAILGVADDAMSEKSYLTALQNLDDAMEELLVMRDHLERLVEQADRLK